MIGPLQVGSASRPIRGERENGDQLAVLRRGAALTIVVADGLGHGPEAAAAAVRAVETVRAHAESDLTELMRRCDMDLRGTRGAALLILRIDVTSGQALHVSVGNVDVAALTAAPFRGIPVAGVVGVRVRKVVVTPHAILPGDLLVIHTDGISSRLSLDPFRDVDPQRAAGEILFRHAKETDDAACVVVRR